MFGLGGLQGKARNMPRCDRLIYAIGDIHGRHDLLTRLLTKIRKDKGDSEAEIILLGDYVDRGPYSRDVLESLSAGAPDASIRLTCLRGNHEQTLLTFLNDHQIGPEWGKHGGVETLASYGVSLPKRRTNPDDWAPCQAQLRENMPAHHLAFLESLPVMADREPYLFVHAGIDPETPLGEQSSKTMMWIREPFLSFNGRFERFVIHGHSADKKPTRKRYRLGIDTGAYITNTLTAVRLDKRGARLIQS
ncbi:metallophosphoesterase family protein [Maricaulis sp. MIT060901]|uniref:metallophosphoesterase family protein n=1 Tax=Maricaulis sp. MIT060901 TaxID=3096993 RepID=UPI003999DC25